MWFFGNEIIVYLDREISSSAQIVCYKKIRDDLLTRFHAIIKRVDQEKRDVFLSFNIDSIISTSWPGVSAPGTTGLSAQQTCENAFYTGRSFQGELVGFSKYNPIIE